MALGSDYATVKYDTSGNEVWVARFNGDGNGSDSAYALGRMQRAMSMSRVAL